MSGPAIASPPTQPAAPAAPPRPAVPAAPPAVSPGNWRDMDMAANALAAVEKVVGAVGQIGFDTRGISGKAEEDFARKIADSRIPSDKFASYLNTQPQLNSAVRALVLDKAYVYRLDTAAEAVRLADEAMVRASEAATASQDKDGKFNPDKTKEWKNKITNYYNAREKFLSEIVACHFIADASRYFARSDAATRVLRDARVVDLLRLKRPASLSEANTDKQWKILDRAYIEATERDFAKAMLDSPFTADEIKEHFGLTRGEQTEKQAEVRFVLRSNPFFAQ